MRTSTDSHPAMNLGAPLKVSLTCIAHHYDLPLQSWTRTTVTVLGTWHLSCPLSACTTQTQLCIQHGSQTLTQRLLVPFFLGVWPAISCTLHEVRNIWEEVYTSILVCVGIGGLIAEFSLVSGVHTEKFPVWACPISCDGNHFEPFTLKSLNCLPNNWEELVPLQRISGEVSIGELVVCKESSDHHSE